jgi:Polyketide cyclase / dehydrase and lipid transport
MASVRVQAVIDCSPEHAWDALRDFGALHTRLARGFVTDVQLDGDDRVVTFAVGTTLREVLIDRDDEARRLAWSIVDGPYAHHNGVAQVFAEPDGRSLFVWVTDLLPDELEARTAEMMAAGIAAITRTLESSAVGA